MSVTWGPCADGRSIVMVDHQVVAEPGSLREAERTARELANGAEPQRVYFQTAGAVRKAKATRSTTRAKAAELPPEPVAKPRRAYHLDTEAELAERNATRRAEMADYSVAQFVDGLATGDFDHDLDALEEAEKAGRNRKGALEAIAARRIAINGETL